MSYLHSILECQIERKWYAKQQFEHVHFGFGLATRVDVVDVCAGQSTIEQTGNHFPTGVN